MPGAGALTERVRFERRAEDANGVRRGAWGADARTVYAKVIFPRGGEAVSQARMQGNQPAVFTVRASAAMLAVDNSWRAVHLRTGRVYNLKSSELHPARDFIDLLAAHDGAGGGA